MASTKQYRGTHAILVTCTSPSGVRQVSYKYHCTRFDYASTSRARQLAMRRARGYERQGWNVVTQTVELYPTPNRAQRRR